MMTHFRLFILALLAATAVPVPAAGQESPPTSSADPLLTVATVREASGTRKVELSPLRPVELLNQALPTLPPMNARVVQTLLSYPREGQHTYYWPRSSDGVSYDGATTDVLLNNMVVLRGESKARAFCCGLTLEVFYRVLQEQPNLPATLADTDSANAFKKLWFCRAIDSPGPEDAMLPFGLGEKIPNDQALPGDFVQLWRANKSGHSVIFIAWARDLTGNAVGLHYWSTQEATNGIGFHTELLGTDDKRIKPEALSVSRMLPPEKWKTPGKNAAGRKK